jgi:hypothetical protein
VKKRENPHHDRDRSGLYPPARNGIFIPHFQVSRFQVSRAPRVLTNACKNTYILTISSTLLIKRPLATQCVTSAILFASSDIIAQQVIERKQEKHDVRVAPYTLSILTYFQSSFCAQHVSLFLEVTLDTLMSHFISRLIIP